MQYMPPELLTYIVAKDLTGKGTSREEFIDRLKRFPRSMVIRLCSVLNLLLSKWTGDYDFDSHAKLARSFFPPPIAERIIKSGRLAFHRHQLLYVAQEALRHCDESGRDVTAPYWGGFGVVLLMASELLYTPFPKGDTTSEELARKICLLLADMEANGLQSYLLKIVRSYVMTSQFIEPLRGKPNFFDLPALFESASGVPLEVYQALIFGAMTRFIKLDDIKKSTDLTSFAVPATWYRSTTVPQEQIGRFFDYVSANADALSKIVGDKKPEASDYTVFRNKPLFADVGYFFPLDIAMLAEKFDSGPFWRVHEYILAEDRGRFHSFWGTVFEDYVNWLFSQCIDGKHNEFFPNPKYADRPTEQVCDGVMLCGRSAVLMEYKSSTFTVTAKYGGSPKELESDLRKKLVGTAESRKGVYQLADAVEKLCRYDKPDRIEGIDMSQVTTVFPLIITRDDLGSALGTNAFLNLHFQELLRGKRFPRSVTPLFCLSADDLEKLSAYLPDTAFAEVLTARYKRDKKLQSSFWLVENSVLKNRGERKPKVLVGQSGKLGRMMAERLGLKDDSPNNESSKLESRSE
jgi:hypothetical protein